MKSTVTIVSASALFLASGACAQTWPQFEGAMKHVLVTFDGTNVGVEIDHNINPQPTPLPMVNYGDAHTAPADVLDGKFISSQYGFLADGFITLPQGAAIWVEMTGATPGIEAYEGGMRMMRANHTYAPIFGTAGSDAAWKWGGTMHHPWFAAANAGSYAMSFNLYIGDENTGAALQGFGSDTVTIDWVTIPAPSSAGLLAIGGLVALRRRR